MVEQLIVPIRREEQMIGAILLESRQHGRLDQEALAFADRLVDHAAIAIDNARLFDQVRQANDAKTDFISFVSHELKQPMTSIKGYVDLLIRGSGGPLTDMQRSFLGTVRSNVDRMADLVADLLEVSRLESGRLRLELEDVPIGRVIELVVTAAREQLRASQHAVEVNLPPDLPPVKADQDRLTQILMNLLSNANKYTPAGGLIEIQAQLWPDGPAGDSGGRFVCCSVRDTGIGISPEDQRHLFSKYFRAEDPSVRSVTGTGLGLVITKSLVELHGGEIWVESQVGQGSTFSFTVPVTREGS
jgi:signal transduction histidine kinase